MKTEELNKARAIYYGLFCSLFSFIDNNKEYENIERIIELLSNSPIDEHSKEALNKMNEFLKAKGFDGLKEENNQVFFSPSTSYIPVTASYYNEDRDDGQKRVEMTNIVLKSTFRKNTISFKDAEDHISFILNFIQKLIEEDLENIENPLVLECFSNILNGFIDLFINFVYKHEESDFYKNSAILLKVFIELERALLNVEKPKEHKRRTQHELFHKKRKEFVKRAKRNFDEVTSL
ncbi:MAG: molecular chaperone TorD family protein [Arcobacter sp.]|uniref:TorD/DmsD family molecular chaperone n=1 Tax=Arcobacter sp. TaxID=1872629 RepID=UPI003C778B86